MRRSEEVRGDGGKKTNKKFLSAAHDPYAPPLPAIRRGKSILLPFFCLLGRCGVFEK